MATYDYQGVVEAVLEKETFPSGFCKQILVLTDPPEAMTQYPNHLPFTFKKDKCNLLTTVQKGETVKVHFAIDGRAWQNPNTNQTKYFTDLTGLSIEKVTIGGNTVEPVPVAPAAMNPAAVDPENLGEDTTDIPF